MVIYCFVQKNLDAAIPLCPTINDFRHLGIFDFLDI